MSKACMSCSSGMPFAYVIRGENTLCANCGRVIPEKVVQAHDKKRDREFEKLLQSGETIRVYGGIAKGGEGKNWGEGKFIAELPAGHPDRMVSSEKQAMEVCREHGIDFGTGQFKSEKDKDRAWNRRKIHQDLKKHGQLGVDRDNFGDKVRNSG